MCAPVGKIEARKMKENSVDHHRVSASSGIEDFCETFERTVKPVVVSTSLMVIISDSSVTDRKLLL